MIDEARYFRRQSQRFQRVAVTANTKMPSSEQHECPGQLAEIMHDQAKTRHFERRTNVIAGGKDDVGAAIHVSADRFAADPDDQDRGVVRAALQVRQVDQKAAGFIGRQRGDDGADFPVADLAAQPVAAQQKDVAPFQGVRPFDIDFDMAFQGRAKAGCGWPGCRSVLRDSCVAGEPNSHRKL